MYLNWPTHLSQYWKEIINKAILRGKHFYTSPISMNFAAQVLERFNPACLNKRIFGFV